MEEKSVKISHRLMLDNRKEAFVTGVKDVMSFDEKEILSRALWMPSTWRGAVR